MLFLLNMVYLLSNEEYSLRFFNLKSFEFYSILFFLVCTKICVFIKNFYYWKLIFLI